MEEEINYSTQLKQKGIPPEESPVPAIVQPAPEPLIIPREI